MSQLIEYVINHTERGACQCGKCVDAPSNPEEHQPEGHTADVVFFKVAAKNGPDAGAFRKLVSEHNGEYGPVNPFDGKEHSYLELGAWIGDQGIALRTMALGQLLGVWKLLTPRKMLGPSIDEATEKQLAGAGYVTIQSVDLNPTRIKE